ncbi:SigE family RNA polymerase sigma factor [Stackebrandtia nassauensis]|uniref:RNA polymerase, sigma-24 subunit, ECF subfamily n=1 Tax=Stackebrandtia nassauensis (strain DSM 44728 / CIP 108903 / NRRL B-16338 / NBRC 102104 / LLR-40K-21) TaxID=446470 RepID=D3QBM6_STANL|nr:SigE family RNA polymerase sigma factor [Stackebrandtia nassauensis]ADD42908.1 RNA polymerase, sigma-24 subunit, ECF subfamily [Stackebrandtia nassauensis DSM 44728]
MTDDPVSEFDAFARARTPALLRAAYLLTGDQHSAEDLVQSALARTMRAWKRLQRTENADAYTRKTMYHLQVRWWRRRTRERQYYQRWEQPGTVSDSSEDVGRQLELQAALRRLTAKQRAVLVLRFFEDLSVVETAEVLRCTTGTVKSQTAKALLRIRAELSHDLTTNTRSQACTTT